MAATNPRNGAADVARGQRKVEEENNASNQQRDGEGTISVFIMTQSGYLPRARKQTAQADGVAIAAVTDSGNPNRRQAFAAV